MTINVFGTKISISVLFSCMIAFLLIVDNSGLMSACFFAVICHESGHLITMRIFNCLPKSINFGLSGILIVGETEKINREKVVIALSGPLSNAIFFGILYFIGKCFEIYIFKTFGAVQLLFCLLNILPIKGLDGGTIMNSFLEKIFGCQKSALYFSIFSVFLASLITIVGFTIFVNNINNPTLMFLGLYLVLLNITKLI